MVAGYPMRSRRVFSEGRERHVGIVRHRMQPSPAKQKDCAKHLGNRAESAGMFESLNPYCCFILAKSETVSSGLS
jgi:hypothetical protein